MGVGDVGRCREGGGLEVEGEGGETGEGAIDDGL